MSTTWDKIASRVGRFGTFSVISVRSKKMISKHNFILVYKDRGLNILKICTIGTVVRLNIKNTKKFKFKIIFFLVYFKSQKGFFNIWPPLL